MTNRAFRFGVVAVPQEGRDRWVAQAQRAESLGYSTFLMPDGIHLLAPWASLATAAAVTSRLRVGTFVLASLLRHPRIAAWDAHSLSVMSGGRFELGIGTGRPDLAKEAAALLGVPELPPAQRLGQVAETIDLMRELDGEQVHTPVMIAAAGPRARAVAVEKADIVAVPVPTLAGRDEAASTFASLREVAGQRYESLELSMNIFVVGDQAPPWIEGFLGTDSASLREADSLSMLRGASPRAMADELQRRRDAYGVSYVTVNGAFFEQAAPVIELLAGA